jgi:hypothetical protein
MFMLYLPIDSLMTFIYLLKYFMILWTQDIEERHLTLVFEFLTIVFELSDISDYFKGRYLNVSHTKLICTIGLCFSILSLVR